MVRSFFFKAWLLAFLAGFVGFIIFFSGQKTASPEPPFIDKISRHSPITVKGLSASKCDGNRLLTHLQADEFKVNPRKYFIFNVRPFNEVTFSNVRFETHFYPDIHGAAGGISFILSEEETTLVKGDNNLDGFGVITRGIIKGLVWEIFNADKLCVRVKAKKAHIDFNKNRTSLKNVTLEQMSPKRIIVSKTVIWNGKDEVFEIPGDYLALTPEGKVSGKGLRLDVEFIVNPFP
jgi:hypothetical protein